MTVKYHGYNIEYPTEHRAGNDPKDTDYNKKSIVLGNALNDTVDRPNNVKHGNAENELDKLGEVVDCLD